MTACYHWLRMKVKVLPLYFLRAITALVSCTYAMTASAQGACRNLPDDEIIVEYFNEISFNEEVNITVSDQGTSFQFLLSCPPAESSDLPPSDFRLRLNTSDGSQYSECGSTAAISVDKAKLTANQVGFCSRTGSCQFTVVLDNRSSRTVYSETVLDITPRNGQTIASPPQLIPATVMICDDSLDTCLTDSECDLSTSEVGVLQLCESPNSCSTVPNVSQYDWNTNPYYKVP